MESLNKAQKINSLTKEFNRRVDEVLKKGVTNQDVIEKLRWNKSMFSLVRNMQRNVPIQKYDLLNEVFQNENASAAGCNAIPEEYYKERIQELRERVEELKQWNAQLREHNQALQLKVHANLDAVLSNQLTHEASSGARQEMALKLLADLLKVELPDIQRAVDNNFALKRLELGKKGSLL